MKYNRPLTEEVPVGKRIEIYKQALDIVVKKKYYNYGLSDSYLCLLLPTLLYELSDFREQKTPWMFYQTPYGFTELTDDVIHEIVNSEDSRITRIEFLKESISKLENNEQIQ